MYDYFSKGHRYETELSFVITTYWMLACMFLTDINVKNYDVTHVSGMLRSPPPGPFGLKHLKVETQQQQLVVLTW